MTTKEPIVRETLYWFRQIHSTVLLNCDNSIRYKTNVSDLIWDPSVEWNCWNQYTVSQTITMGSFVVILALRCIYYFQIKRNHLGKPSFTYWQRCTYRNISLSVCKTGCNYWGFQGDSIKSKIVCGFDLIFKTANITHLQREESNSNDV